MTAALYSPHWHEVAHLRPSLRSAVRHRRQASRGCVWHILSGGDAGPGAGRQLRLNGAAWRLVGLFDGRRDLDTLWRGLQARFGDAAPSQPEVLALLAQLHGAGFIRADVPPDLPAQSQAARQRDLRRRLAAFSPLSMQMRLFNPAPWLNALLPWALPLFSPVALMAWWALILVSGLYAVSEWSSLAAALGQAAHSPHFVLLAWMVYPLMKAVHELAHGLAMRRWGGVVESAGLTLLLLVPVPFVDASAANGLPRRQRMAVSAAGVMSEAFLAALAFWLWLVASPGLARDVALTVFFIGGLSSLFFNGNPLLRFDGYHFFCDALDLPNLAVRSRRWWHALLGRTFLRLPGPLPETAPGEVKWLFFYAPAAWLFQCFVAYRITFWIAGWQPVLGSLAALAFAFTLLALPPWRAVREWLVPEFARPRSPARRRLTFLAGGLALFAMLVPLPAATTVPGVVDLPEDACLRVKSAGFLREILIPDGALVQPGDLIARLEDPALLAEQEAARQRLAGLQSQYFGQLLQDPRQAEDLSLQVASATAELAALAQRTDDLEIKAQAAGQLALPHQADLTGGFLPRGQILGHVLQSQPLTVLAIVPQEEEQRVRRESVAIEIRLAGVLDTPLTGRVSTASAGSSRLLPHPALSDHYGGAVPTIPGDAKGNRALRAFYAVRVTGQAAPGAVIGQRAWVRFAHGPEPLVWQVGRAIRQTLLGFFDGEVRDDGKV